MVSPKWQTMWVESQHCSKSIVSVPVLSQQASKILEDLKNSCCSSNKAVQVEALKCWGLWIHHQNPDDWKLNVVCFSAVRPLITKKLQPLHKDVEISKLRLSLMWALLVKVQEIMHLEGPQYILEVFLQSCLTWLSSTNGNGSENEVNFLIFQLLLAVFNKNETLADCDKEMFPPLTNDVLHIKKVFHRLAEKFLNIFIHWRKVSERSVVLKIWKNFLEHCELSYEHIPIPVWHNIFKIVGQICSEKESPVKERLAFLHRCATTLKSALSSSKFIDFGNLLTTPCEVLLKKLVELCTIECDEFCDSEMFLLSKETCQVLSCKSVAINGYDLCISVLDFLEEFCLRSLFWGVWCGLVYCYKTLLNDTNGKILTKTEIKFYRKLRGFVVNFELDRNDLHEDCIKEVEKHIGFLNIGCINCCRSVDKVEVKETNSGVLKPRLFNGVSKEIVPLVQQHPPGKFSVVPFYTRKKSVHKKFFDLNIDLMKDVFSTLTLSATKSLLTNLRISSMFIVCSVRTPQVHCTEMVPRNMLLKADIDTLKKVNLVMSCREAESPPSHKPPCTFVKKCAALPFGKDQTSATEEDVISTPKTRSMKRAEEEKKKELEMHRRRKRKSFEVLVQEIVRKNKERKTEKNNKRRKSPDSVKNKRKKKKSERQQEMENQKTHCLQEKENKMEASDRKLRNRKKEDPSKNQKKNEKVSRKTDGKLENYFKVITKKSGSNTKEVKKPPKAKKRKRKMDENSCCNFDKDEERKGEIGWKQTSLKTMMNPKSKADKVKQGGQARDKIREIAEEKLKLKKDDRKVVGSSLAKLSPFKEVYHDHEYAKINPDNLESFQNLFDGKKDRSRRKEKSGKPNCQNISLESEPSVVVEKVNLCSKTAFSVENTLKIDKIETRESVNVSNEAPEPSFTPTESKMEFQKPEVLELLTVDECPDESKSEDTKGFDGALMDVDVKNTSPREGNPENSDPKLLLREGNCEFQSPCPDDSQEDFSNNDLVSDKKLKKRSRISDSLKPRKKFKPDKEVEEYMADEKLPLEVTEKENLEEKQPELVLMSPVKKEKVEGLTLKNNGSPNMMKGGMSRASRIIGLVPESTMGRSWESSPRVEALKCLKAPNVDKNSRASKMLALLSENIVEAEIVKANEKKINSNLKESITPNAKTPLSSLKSPKSLKKRRSIRFDDTRNETVIYRIDTPPSQILKDKEKLKKNETF